MNKVILMGRLTKDPEIRYTQTTNKPVTSFTLAVNRRFANNEADFINIVAWNKTAEFAAKYFNKGQQVGVIGRLQVRDYEDTQGQKRYVTEVIAEEVYFADSKRGDAWEDPNATVTDNTFNPFSDDDLPF